MKKFAKKHLAIAVFMMAFGGMTNMAHASETTIYSQDVSADKEVRQGGAAKVEFAPSPNEIISGVQEEVTPAFVLKVSDSAEHSGWRFIPTGSSRGSVMYNDQGDTVKLSSTSSWTWAPQQSGGYYYINGSGSQEEKAILYIVTGTKVKAGVYHFTGRVEEFL
ncbi:MyfA/PsaA family fimbrial adhesin [Yersinia alsatica]|uniref:MyfA/PsaA family fimbrial adhesin n=1 Tax=Yersinia alsatica TaxID=2890317 RepID=UPI0011A66665|nr:MyfA/PsaA family fimbrial adhesin [Yersinia alsatica]